MKIKLISCCVVTALFLMYAKGEGLYKIQNIAEDEDYITAFKDTLNHLSVSSDNEFFKMHCNSIIEIIDSKGSFTSQDSAFLKNTYDAFNNDTDTCSAKELSTYLERRRPFILSWVSPTDGEVSFSWFNPPKNWDPENEYPLYIQLHGLWSVASNSIVYMTYPFLTNASNGSSFEDGYLLSPWGRGNLWYQEISETDIWECMAALEEIVKVNPARKYLSGHSMGGYGAWHIAIKSAHTWAALGVHAGALWYGGSSELNSTVAETLKDLPTYFVCGTEDGLLSVNQTAYQLLEDAGNANIEFVTFTGGHVYIEENVENMYLWMRNFVNDDYPVTDIEKQEISSRTIPLNNYPNPFDYSTTISFSLSGIEHVSLEIYNYIGQVAGTLINGEQTAGEHEITWTPKDLPAGIYYCRLQAGDFTETIRIILKK
jgi:hypothetical protein